MIIHNVINKTLGRPAIFLGLTFFVPGISFMVHGNFITGSVSLLVSLLLFFTSSGIEINTEKREYRVYYKWFRLFKTGRWKPLDRFIGVTLVPMKKVFTTYSRSNRRWDETQSDFRIYLVNRAKKPDLLLKICKTPEQAQDALDEFSLWLKLPVFSVKKH